MSQPLQGKVALVSGAGKNIGRAIALALARQGCRLLLHCNASRDAAEALAAELQASGTHAVVLQADLSRTDDAAMFSRSDCQWSPSSNDT